MKKKVFLIIAIVFVSVNTSNAQANIYQKLIGVWETKVRGIGFCMVFTDPQSGAFTNPNGLVYSYFSFQTTPKNGATLLTSHNPSFHNEKDFDRSLMLFVNDSTLSIISKIHGKSALLMQDKSALIYKKQHDIDAQKFLKKTVLKDLLGTWFSAAKKDTLLSFNFQSNNVLKIKNIHTQKQIIGSYLFNPDLQPMTLDMTNEKGEKISTICMFEFGDYLRIAGPKNDKRRNPFTVFGDNMYLVKEK